MPLPTEAGRYDAVIKDHIVSRDEEKNIPQMIVTLDIESRWDKPTKSAVLTPGMFITGYVPLFVTDKETGEVVPWESKVQSVMGATGWDGKKLSELGAMDLKGKSVSLVIELGTTGKPYVKWLNQRGGGALKKPDPKDVAAMDSEFDLIPAVAVKQPLPPKTTAPKAAKRTTSAAAVQAPADPDDPDHY